MGIRTPTHHVYGYPCLMCPEQVDAVLQCGHACFCHTCSKFCLDMHVKCPVCDVLIAIVSPKKDVGFLWNLYLDSTFQILEKRCIRDLSRQSIINNIEHVRVVLVNNLARNNYRSIRI